MKVFGLLLVIGGMLLGIYVGGWVMFIGGIVGVIEAAKAAPVDALGLLLSLLQTASSAVVGAAVVFLMVVPGVALMAGKKLTLNIAFKRPW